MFRVPITAVNLSARGLSLRRRRVWYGDDGDDGNPPPSGDNDGKSDAGKGDGDKSDQERINKLVGQARKEGRETALRGLLEELGFGNKDELAALVKAAKDKADADKTEAQKLAEKLDAEAKKREAAEKMLSEREAAYRIERRNAAVESAATKAGAKYPADVLALLERHESAALGALMDDEGKIDPKAVDALIVKHKKERAELYKSSAPGTQSNEGGDTTGDARKKEALKDIKIRY